MLLFMSVSRDLGGGFVFEEDGFLRRLDLGLAFGLEFLGGGLRG